MLLTYAATPQRIYRAMIGKASGLYALDKRFFSDATKIGGAVHASGTKGMGVLLFA